MVIFEQVLHSFGVDHQTMATPTLAQESVAPATSLATPRMRYAELLLVLGVGILQPLMSSSFFALSPSVPKELTYTNARYVSGLVQEAVALFVLWYVVKKNNRSFSEFGLSISLSGLLRGIFLGLGTWVCSGIAALVISWAHFFWYGAYPKSGIAINLTSSSVFIALIFLLVNPWFEELIVRGFVTTELSSLTGSVFAASVASVVLQTSYHLYQGWYNATIIFVVFTVFAYFYAKNKDLFSIVVAHATLDLGAFGLQLLSKR